MKSCDISVVQAVVDGISYDQSVLAAGITTRLSTCTFGGHHLHILEGRECSLVENILDQLAVPHRPVELSSVRRIWAEGVDALLMVAPYFEAPEAIEKMDPRRPKFFANFTTHLVTRIDSDGIDLMEIGEDGNRVTTWKWAWVEKLAGMTAKPLGRVLTFLIVDRHRVTTHDFAAMLQGRHASLHRSQGDADATGSWVQGAAARRHLAEVLGGWAAWAPQVKYVFFQSMLSGSAFFYRREYAQALQRHLGVTGPGEEPRLDIVRPLIDAGNRWRALGRYTRSCTVTGADADVAHMHQLIQSAGELEDEFLRAIEGDHYALCS